MSEGRIFSLEAPPVVKTSGLTSAHKVERYWLCGNCAMHLKVVVENGEVTTRPLHAEFIREPRASAAAAGRRHVRR